MRVIINYNDNRWKKYKIDFEAIANAAAGANGKDAEVSIILTDDKHIRKLNSQYRGIDKPTNVLSFEMGDPVLLGDIFISFDTVMKEAKNSEREFIDHASHMVVHGVLHLLGYDHLNDVDANKMEGLEIKILDKIGIENPYQEDVKPNIFKIFLNILKSDKISFIQVSILFISGLIASLGFAPFYIWFATVFGIGIAYYLSICESNNKKFWHSFLRILPFGAGYGLGMFWWVTNSIFVVPEIAVQFAIFTIPALIGIAILSGIIFSIPFVSVRRVRTNSAYRAFFFAAIWALVLWLREWLFTGFPWNPIANITMPFPMLANSMSVWGALGLTFIIIGLIASIIELLKYKKGLIQFFIFTILLSVGIIFGYKNIKVSENLNTVYSPVIRIVQPAKSASQKASHSRAEAIANADKNIADLIVLAKSGDDNNYDIVIFPETAYPYIVYKDKISIAKDLNVPIITGALSYNRGQVYNSMVISNQVGDVEKIYSKSHLVPFGEYRPFGDLIPTPGQLTSGSGPEILSLNIKDKVFNFAPAICYEIIFSDSLVPKNSEKAPHAIINITNDTWFGKTPGTYQHLDMVRRYAIESGLPIVRANYSGVSAFIMPDGNIVSQLSVGKPGVLDGQVGGDHITIYRKIGRDLWMIIILLFATICAASIAGFQKKD